MARSRSHLTPEQRSFISKKIRLLVHEGRPQRQAIAIAYRMAGVPPLKSRKQRDAEHTSGDPRRPRRVKGTSAASPFFRRLRREANAASERAEAAEDSSSFKAARLHQDASKLYRRLSDAYAKEGYTKEAKNAHFTSVGHAASAKHHLKRLHEMGRDRSARDPGRLTAAERHALPSHLFALPERRALPMPDASHARNAAARLAQMKKRGTVTAAEFARARFRILARYKQLGIGKFAARARPQRRVERRERRRAAADRDRRWP